jgi:hypothetical protein
MTPNQLRVQHSLPKQHPSIGVHLAPVINSSLPYIQAMSSRIPEHFLFQAQNSPFAK